MKTRKAVFNLTELLKEVAEQTVLPDSSLRDSLLDWIKEAELLAEQTGQGQYVEVDLKWLNSILTPLKYKR